MNKWHRNVVKAERNPHIGALKNGWWHVWLECGHKTASTINPRRKTHPKTKFCGQCFQVHGEDTFYEGADK